MKAFEERLKTARLVHRLLIGTCVAILAFATSPDYSERYTEAIAELEKLRALELALAKDFPPHVEFWRDPKNFEDSKKLPGDRLITASVSNGVVGAVMGVGGVKSATLTPRSKYFCAAFNQGYVDRLLRGGTLDDYREFLLQNIGVHHAHPLGVSLGQQLAERLEQDEDLRKAASQGPVDLELTMAIVGMKYPQADSQGLRVDVLFDVRILPGDEHLNPLKLEDVPHVAEYYADSRFQCWLSQRPKLKPLIVEGAVLPALSKVADKVAGDKTLDAALGIMQEERRKNQQTADLFSLSLEGSRLVVVGPLVTLLLLLYLLAHVVSIQESFSGKAGPLEASSWMAVYPNRLAIALTFLSLVALPAVTLFWLLVRMRALPSEFLVVELLFGVAAVAVGAWTFACVCSLRQRSAEAADRGGHPGRLAYGPHVRPERARKPARFGERRSLRSFLRWR
jgi:hypothetical protein